MTWTLEDDVLAPRERIEINYSGPNPFSVCKKITSSVIKRVFEVGGTDVWERDFRWDITGDPRPFYMRMFVNKGFDARTGVVFEITYQGAQPSDPTKDGNVVIRIGGRMKTTFERETTFQKSSIYYGLLWLYNKIFYSGVRRNYLKIAQQRIDEFNKQVRGILGMPTMG